MVATTSYKAFFGTLANKIRLDLLFALRTREKNVSELINELDLKQSTVSHNLRRLCSAGLLRARQDGPFHYFSLNPAMAPLMDLMGTYTMAIERRTNVALAAAESTAALSLKAMEAAENAVRGANEERKRMQEKIRLMQEVTLSVAQSENLDQALEALVRKICEAAGWAVGQAWVPLPDGSELTCGASWCDGRAETFRLLGNEAAFSPGADMLGQVWTSKEPAWLPDLSAELKFLRGAQAAAAGIRSGVVIPVIAGEEVIAVIEFFMRETQNVKGCFVRFVQDIVQPLGQVLQAKANVKA